MRIDLNEIQHWIKERSRILDLGCGTGIWAIDMAEYVVPCNCARRAVMLMLGAANT